MDEIREHIKIKMELKPSQELNLISRMAGNIFSKGVTEQEAVSHAVTLYKRVRQKLIDETIKELTNGKA